MSVPGIARVEGAVARHLVAANTGVRRRAPQVPTAPLLIWLLAGLVVLVMLLPVAYLILRAIGAGAETWQLLLRTRTLEVLLRTAGLALLVTSSSAAISIPLAWLTVRTDLPFRKLWSVLAILPLVIPTYVGGFVLVASLGPKGMFQQLLSGLGVERLPEIYGFPGAVLALTLFSYPYLLLSVRAGLQSLDPAVEEASRSLGHRPWSTFWRVTLPQLRPALASGSLLVALYTLSDFGAVSLLQFDSFTRAIYLQYQGSFDRTMAALLALLLVAFTGLILLVEARTRGRARYHRSSAGSIRPAAILRLGRWRWPSLVFCGLVVLLALILPVFVLVYWLLQGLAQGIQPEVVWNAALNSTYSSGLAALVTVVAALPVAILAVRYPGKVSGWLERATYAGFALPGIVIALALVFFGANYATPLYQTLALLLLAYTVRFLPQAVGATRTSLLQVSPRLEEAGRGLGRTHPVVLATITLPLVRPGILAGLAMVFLTTMKELPATLLLSPIGFKTLATTIWSATSGAFFAAAAAPALLLVLVSGLSIVLLIRTEGRLRGE
ncbi:MAG: iron ABC transporter permease [Chloroflexi bacterium]|nr:iron ABC transporter permease [Chloroflexota bacterium]